MKTDMRIVASIVIAAGIGIAAAYMAGSRTGSTPPQTSKAETPATATAQPSQPPAAASVPTPPTAAAAATKPAALPPQSGRAHLHADTDPDAKFTHFRVGQRNVKQILADGDLMWVGTSGGVIRYNIKTDDYKPFDLRSGLLANGIFHISKIDGRLVVGTYGGGMSIYDAANEKWDTYNIPQGLGDAFVYGCLYQLP